VVWFTRSSLIRRYNWEPNYQEKSEQPFGTKVLFRLLETYFPNHSVFTITHDLSDVLPLSADESTSTYFFIGQKPYYDSAATAHLLAFVEAGNTAFISSKYIPFDLMHYLYYEECPEATWSDYVVMQADTLRLQIKNTGYSGYAVVYFAVKNVPTPFEWSYIPKAYFCAERPQVPLGVANDTLVYFACFPYGKGFFYLHSVPLALTNYHLLRQEMQAYTEAVLGYLPEGDIYWDMKYRDPGAMQPARVGNRRLPSEHPLLFVLQKPPLAQAWYLLVALALLYVLFRGKRRQRIVALRLPKENLSTEQVNALAQIHYQRKNYRHLCEQMMKAFLQQVRVRFGLALTIESLAAAPVSEGFITALSSLSEVPGDDIRLIFNNYTRAMIYEANEEMLHRLQSNLETFWEKATKQKPLSQ